MYFPMDHAYSQANYQGAHIGSLSVEENTKFWDTCSLTNLTMKFEDLEKSFQKSQKRICDHF